MKMQLNSKALRLTLGGAGILLASWTTAIYAACDPDQVADLTEELREKAEDLEDIINDYDYKSMDDLLRDVKELSDQADDLASDAKKAKKCSKIKDGLNDLQDIFEEVYSEVIETLEDSHESTGGAVIVGGTRTVTVGGRPTRVSVSTGPGSRYDFHANYEIVAKLVEMEELMQEIEDEL